MPTALDRIQVLCKPELFAEVKTLAKHNRRTLSAMAAELIAEAVNMPKYQTQIEEAEVHVPAKPDPRKQERQAQYKAESEIDLRILTESIDDDDSDGDYKMKKLAKALKLMQLLEDA